MLLDVLLKVKDEQVGCCWLPGFAARFCCWGVNTWLALA